MSESNVRRTEILARATTLFASQGVDGTSVRDIAEAVGMLSGSLYHHFPSKDAMVDAVLVDFLADLRSGLVHVVERENDPQERIKDLIQFTFNVAREAPEATAIYQRDGEKLAQQPRYGYIGEANAAMRSTWIDAIVDGVERGTFRKDLDPLVAYRLMHDSVWSAARWFSPTAEYSTARFTKDCAAVFLAGYSTQAA